MNRILSITFLVIGVVFLSFGINAQDSLLSSAKEAVTGTPTDRSMWLMLGGVISVIIGGFGSFFHHDIHDNY